MPESEYWLSEADKIVAAYPEKHRDYHAMQLRHAYERGLSAAPASKLLSEIRESLASRLALLRADSQREPHRREAECDYETENAIDVACRSIETFLTPGS